MGSDKSPAFRSLDRSSVTLCLCLTQARTPDYPLMAAACGFDTIYVDLEHTVTSVETAVMLCIAASGAGLIPFVRVPSHDHELMTRALDMGARGIIVPHIDTVAQARDVVDTCRFAPAGKRSVIGPNPVNRYAAVSIPDTVAFCETQTIVTVMLETPTAIENADAIAALRGVDMILIGANDLSQEMGILGEYGSRRFRDAVASVTSACDTHGKIAGLAGVSDLGLLDDFVAAGIRFISAGTETGLFMEAARARVKALRGLSLDGTTRI